jgi:hypothetical protein
VFGKGIKVHSGISCQGRHFVRGTKTSTPAPPGHRPAHEQVIAKPSSARSSLNQTEKLKPEMAAERFERVKFASIKALA